MEALDYRLLGIRSHTSKYLKVLQNLLCTFIEFECRRQIFASRCQIIFGRKGSNLVGDEITDSALVIITLPVHGTQ